MSFSDFISIFALVVSAVSLYLSWRQYRRDRSHLDALITVDNKYGEPIYSVRVVNKGRRPATVNRIYARVRNKKRYPVYDTLVSLEEMDKIDFTVPMAGFSSAHDDPDFIVAFEVEDTSGKTFVFKTRNSLRK